MVNMTEHMIAQLLPTIRSQVQFMRMRSELVTNVSAPNLSSQPTPDAPAVLVERQNVRGSYKLPKFPPVAQKLLDSANANELRTGSRNRSAIIDAVYDDLIKMGVLYPSRVEYDHVISALLLDYPFLQDYDGSGNSWRFALRSKFKRCRQPLVSDEHVAEMRAKYGRPGISGRKRKRTSNLDTTSSGAKPGLKIKRFKVVPENPMGEDDKSVSKHVTMMKEEMKKREPNSSILQESMKRTVRYRQLYCHNHTTKEVLTEFPALKKRLFLIADAKLIYDLDLVTIGPKLLALKDQIMVESKSRHKRHSEIAEQLERSMQETLSADAQQDLSLCACIELLPSLFKEDDSFLYQPDGQVKGPTPCITGRRGETFHVAMDGVDVVAAKTFKQALEAWIATFWLFSVAYPEKLRNTCCFFEKVILNVGGRVSAPVRKWANRLKVPSH